MSNLNFLYLTINLNSEVVLLELLEFRIENKNKYKLITNVLIILITRFKYGI